MGLREKELKDLELAGFLHDIGKIGTYKAILDKDGKTYRRRDKAHKAAPDKGRRDSVAHKTVKRNHTVGEIPPGVLRWERVIPMGSEARQYRSLRGLLVLPIPLMP